MTHDRTQPYTTKLLQIYIRGSATDDRQLAFADTPGQPLDRVREHRGRRDRSYPEIRGLRFGVPLRLSGAAACRRHNRSRARNCAAEASRIASSAASESSDVYAQVAAARRSSA